MTRTWRVWGANESRQRESFEPSYKYDWTEGEKIREIEVENSDKTGTNEYSIIRITRNTAEECEAELEGQLSDGIFESVNYGKGEELVDGSWIEW